MNLTDYRREMREAHEEYRETLATAADRLSMRLLTADAEFTGENEIAKAVHTAEDVAIRRHYEG